MNCHGDDYQDAYARAWRALCRSEGHMPGLPRSDSEAKGHLPKEMRERLKAEAVRLRAEGLSHVAIGARLGMSEHFSRNVCREAKEGR